MKYMKKSYLLSFNNKKGLLRKIKNGWSLVECIRQLRKNFRGRRKNNQNYMTAYCENISFIIIGN